MLSKSNLNNGDIKNQSLNLIVTKFLINPKGKIHGRHWLTCAGIALGVFALLTVSSVMNGFDKDMRQRIIGTRAEIRIDIPASNSLSNYESLIDRLNKLPYIKASTPVIRNELMLVNGSNMAATVSFGIDLNKQRAVSPILLPIKLGLLKEPSHQWLQGLVTKEIRTKDFEDKGIIIGADLAQSIYASVGDTLKLVSPLGSIPTPLGLLPRTQSVRVVGIFIAGMPEYDRLYSYIPLSVGQYFSSYQGQIDHIDIKTNNPKQLYKMTKNLQKAFPQYRVENWSSFDTSLYNAMHFEKYLMMVILGLMFILSSFNMSGNIFKTIIQKRKTIGIMKTIGFRDTELMSVFMKQGLIIGSAGILFGILLSLFLLLIQSYFSLIRLPVGNMPSLILPVDIRLKDYLIVPLISLFITWLSIYIPARSAKRINPIKLIREII